MKIMWRWDYLWCDRYIFSKDEIFDCDPRWMLLGTCLGEEKAQREREREMLASSRWGRELNEKVMEKCKVTVLSMNFDFWFGSDPDQDNKAL